MFCGTGGLLGVPMSGFHLDSTGSSWLLQVAVGGIFTSGIAVKDEVFGGSIGIGSSEEVRKTSGTKEISEEVLIFDMVVAIIAGSGRVKYCTVEWIVSCAN